MNSPVVYLIPTVLQEDAIETIPAYVFDAVRDCQSFFVENERTARRFLKKIWKEMVIDAYEWHAIPKQGEDEDVMLMAFMKNLKEKKNIGIISEAGCPGIADPGQRLVAIAPTKCNCKTTSRAELYFTCTYGKRVKWTAISIRGLYTHRCGRQEQGVERIGSRF